ncbi:MAG: MgtC/SapB family protein [bacterium]|nr:MgtC/SapB family protein [bacterium]
MMNNILNFLDPTTADMIFQLTVAMLLGMLIGAERSTSNKTAGMRTYALISLGSCLFVVISHAVSNQYLGLTNFDPMRVASQIVVGIGFVGGGLIMTEGKKVSGITTAAGLWVSAGIGMAVGFHLYALSIFVTLTTLFIFTALWHLERAIKNYSKRHSSHGENGD